MTTLTAFLIFAAVTCGITSTAVYVLFRATAHPKLIYESELTFFLKVFFFWPFAMFGRGKNG